MSRHAFNPPGETPPSPMYSFGASAEGWVHTSGIVAIDERGVTQHSGDARAQTDFVLCRIGKILAQRDCSFDDVVLAQIFLKSMSDYQDMNSAYATYFPSNAPARFCISAGLVKDDWLVEINVIAKAK